MFQLLSMYDVQYMFYTCSYLYKCKLSTTLQPATPKKKKKTNLKGKDAILK